MRDDTSVRKRDDEINVEEIMEKIRENMIRKQKATVLMSDNDFRGLSSTSSSPIFSLSPIPGDARDIAYLSNNWNIQNISYTISSHRPVIGKILVKAREVVIGDVRRYIDPIILRQTEFNLAAANQISDLQKHVGNMERQFQDLKRLLMKNHFQTISRLHGTREEIKWHYNSFLPYFRDCHNVLVIGSGQGEFLEIMKELDIVAHGLDNDAIMVEFCRSYGFDVELNDYYSYLENLDDEILDGIFINFLFKQPKSESIIHLLNLCHQKIKTGHYCIIESINPISIASFSIINNEIANYRPASPKTMKCFLESAGFFDLEVRLTTSVPDESQLRKLPVTEKSSDEERQRVEIQNRNIEILNELLYGSPSFAAIGRK